jgi:8-oxo-dGTP pyrophosphatase MutT (NUDIX family)
MHCNVYNGHCNAQMAVFINKKTFIIQKNPFCMQQKNERHCTGIFLYKFNTEINQYEIALIQSQKFRHHSTGSLLWTIPGGRIEPEDQGSTIDERILACARREVREELGIELEYALYYPELNSQKTGAEIGYQDPETMFYFYECTARVASDQFHVGQEVERVEWFPLNQLPEPMTEDICALLHTLATHTEQYFKK